MIRTELDQVVRCAEKSTTDTTTVNNNERGGHQRLVARVVVLDDDEDEEDEEGDERKGGAEGAKGQVKGAATKEPAGTGTLDQGALTESAPASPSPTSW